MAIVGFNFTKLLVQRLGDLKGKVNIQNNVTIKEVLKTDLSLGKAKQSGLKIDFEFKSDYEPKVAEIIIEGTILDLQEDKKIDDLIKEFKKTKKLPPDMMTPVINAILMKCNIQALIMSRDVNLPPPIPLPKVQQQIKA